MSKETKKAKKFNYNLQVIDRLVEKYGLSAYYVKQCAAGRRDGIIPDKIKKEYRILSNAASQAVESKINQL
ncbi:MAG TPA: hypothetical protein VL022_04685 [Moheibacter sp.]|nr:hypothetical protein [Moheibacter sp.]